MRIWDVNPGYLNRQSLLGEHRELHGIVSIMVNNKQGYASHPETIRWRGYGWALRQRHLQLAAEMSLRGYSDKSPVLTRSNQGHWPVIFIDSPARQFQILASKYDHKEQGRIPLPVSAQQLWSHHKYSVLARDSKLYKEIGRKVSGMRSRYDFSALATLLTELLRKPPENGGLRNALQHMWGYVSDYQPPGKGKVESWTMGRLFGEVQWRAVASMDSYLMSSTALSELQVWLRRK